MPTTTPRPAPDPDHTPPLTFCAPLTDHLCAWYDRPHRWPDLVAVVPPPPAPDLSRPLAEIAAELVLSRYLGLARAE